jgi:hypothetical protein
MKEYKINKEKIGKVFSTLDIVQQDKETDELIAAAEMIKDNPDMFL